MMRVSILLLLAIVSFAYPAVASQYCDNEGDVTVFLIDRTTEYDEVDKENFSAMAQEIFDGLKSRERLLVAEITGSAEAPKVIFDECVPGCKHNSIFDNCDILVRRARLDFRDKYVTTLEGVITTPDKYNDSIIIIGIKIALDSLRGRMPRKLFMFSDLIENSKLGNFMNEGAVCGEKVLNDVRRLHLLPNLLNTEVHISGYGRDDERRRVLSPVAFNCIKEFWYQYFSDSGAKAVTISER